MHAPPVATQENRAPQSVPRPVGSSAQSIPDNRSEAAAQLKLQELADGSPQVRQLQSMQENVVQLAKADASKVKRNHYKEKYNKTVKISKKRPTKYDMLKISETDYNKMGKDSRRTEEEGYTDIDLEVGEKKTDWVLNDRVVEFNGSTIQKKGTFKLPISCIESAEHVVHYSNKSGAIPDWKNQKRSVDLLLNNNNTGTNETALSVSNDELLSSALQPYGSFDFSTSDVQLNEGLLVIDPDDPSSTLHAVVVVGKNTATNQVMVLERNAGKTSGNTLYYVDDSWLLNVYDSPADFYNSMNDPNLVIGKLVAH